MIYSNLNRKGYFINLFSYYYTGVLLKNSIYVQVEEKEVKETIKCVLSTAADKNFITTEELKAMLADDKNSAKFLMHKTRIPGNTPPGRPIISGSGSGVRLDPQRNFPSHNFPETSSPTQFPQQPISPTLTSPVTNFPRSNFPNTNFPSH